MLHNNVFSWIDKNIKNAIENIDLDVDREKNLKLLDSLISMRKKYDGSIDILGERIRVIEDFINFVKLHHNKELLKFKKICIDFLEDQPNT